MNNNPTPTNSYPAAQKKAAGIHMPNIKSGARNALKETPESIACKKGNVKNEKETDVWYTRIFTSNK
jgi:hypothetical protein